MPERSHSLLSPLTEDERNGHGIRTRLRTQLRAETLMVPVPPSGGPRSGVNGHPRPSKRALRAIDLSDVVEQRAGSLGPRRALPSSGEATCDTNGMPPIPVAETHPQRAFTGKKVRLGPGSLLRRGRPSIDLAQETTHQMHDMTKRPHEDSFERAARGCAAR